MGYKINQKPVLPNNGTAAPTPAAAPVVQSQTTPEGSSNQQFGMKDVPESEKNKIITPEEVSAKLARGELMYGPVPTYPTMDAIDGIKFDYCDGLRVFIPKAANDLEKKKYLVHIIDAKYGVVLHSAMLESDNYITTVQKFYTEIDLTIIKMDNIAKDILDVWKDKYKEINVDDYALTQVIDLARVPDITEEIICREFFAKHPEIEVKDKHEELIREVATYINTNMKFVHKYNTEGKDVMVQLPVGTIGDSVGWFAYVERFQQKTKANIICVMNPIISILFKKQYPTITFIEPKDTLKYNPYACYKIGLFFKGNTTDQPYDFRYIGNHRTASKILDTDDADIAPRVDLSAPRKIKEPYVCIAVQASAYCKLWTNPTGWHDVIKQLKDIGYRVICIDKDPVTGQGVATNHMPWGVEDETGNKPLQERINLLKDCDFFIGLSSGVSWLAWMAKCPVVMISGFTNPFNEFYTPYRVINTLFCHGCWNDERCEFDHYDYMWCPRHKGTEKAYECSKVISSAYVMNVIKTIPAYQKQLRAANNEKLAKKANEYIIQHAPAGTEVLPNVSIEHIEGIRATYAKTADAIDVVKEFDHLSLDVIEYIISNIKLEK